MSTFTVSAGARIDAPARTIYDLIADYRVSHPKIVPPQYFERIDVEKGGVGEGTVIRVTMRVLGAARTYRAVVTEPEPGRVITETDLATGLATSFTVVPNGEATDVTITTVAPRRPGIRGALESWLVGSMLKRVYPLELALIAKVAKEN